MEGEMATFIKVWISAIASLTYCYIISFQIPKGKFRFLSLLPVFYFLTVLPFDLTSVTLGGLTSFFLTWLANFKLLLFSFGKGPLSSNPSISFSHFISMACFPIKIKNEQTPSSPKRTKSPLNLAIKLIILALLSLVYQYKQHLHPKVMLAYYCCYMYVGLEIDLALVAALVGKFLNLELEPQFNEPYLSTSLQDFWGRRWNLMVTNILRPTVYEPVRSLSFKILPHKWAPLPAVLVTFITSALMHEVVFYYLSHVSPSWEVTWFFVLQGVLVVLEIAVKKVFKGRLKLHPVVSWAFTAAILMITGNWLFFPPLLRCKTDVRVSREVMALVDYFKNFGMSNTVASGCRLHQKALRLVAFLDSLGNNTFPTP